MKAIDVVPKNAKELIEKQGFKVNLSKEDPYSKERYIEVSKAYSFLQYQCVIRPLILRKYNISIRFLELLLYLYPMQYFDKRDYAMSVKALSWNVRIMLKYEWIKIISEGANRGEHIYGLSAKAKHIVEDYYKYMSGEKQLPEFVPKIFQRQNAADIKKSVLLEKFIKEGPRDESTKLFLT